MSQRGQQNLEGPDRRYHREVYDLGDDDDYAVTGPVEAHGHSLDFGLLLLRLGVLVLALHGLTKILDLDAFTETVGQNPVGAQAPELFAWLVVLGQLVLPVLVAVGLFTRPAAFLVALMMVAVWVLVFGLAADLSLLAPNGAPAGESALLYAALALPLVFTGAGRWSVDSLRTGGRP